MSKKPTYEELEKQISELESELQACRENDISGIRKSDHISANPESILLGSIINNAHNVIYVKDTAGRFILTNKWFCEILGLQEKDVLGQTTSELFPQETAAQHIENDNRIIQLKKPVTFNEQVQLADGRHDLISVKFPILSETGSVIAVGGISTDISERVRAEEKLRESETRFRLAFHTSPDSINLNRVSDGKYIDINEGFTNLTGYTREDVIGKKSLSLNIWKNPEDRKRLVDGLLEKGYVENLEAEFVRKNGTVGTGLMSARTFRISKEDVILSITRDISKLKIAQEALHRSEKLNRLLLEQANAIVWTVDKNLRFTSSRGAGLDKLGLKQDQVVGQSLQGFFKMDRSPSIAAAKQAFDGHSISYEESMGSTTWLSHVEPFRDIDGTIFGCIGISLDITDRKQGEAERKQLESQLLRSQKMEAIGTLAGGIAHDFNNILAAIIGYSELAQNAAAESDLVQEYFKEVLIAGNRAKDLVQQILTFSRQGEEVLKPIHLKPITMETIKLLRASLPSTIEIRQNIRSTFAVMGDPVKIHQVLMNLCTNAAHAMQEKGGVLELGLADVQLGPEEMRIYPDLSPGSYVNLTVSDSGLGMSQQVMERIFDPFFTKKKKGEGTGLGLSVVHGIVNNMNGIIEVKSTLGRGSTFQTFFPAITHKEEAATLAEESMVTGNERVLFVDDEPVLVDIAKKMLQPLGYQVTIRTSPIEALEVFRFRPQDFDVVVSDLTMPQMTGDKLAKAILDIRPDIPVILCTGFSATMDEKRASKLGGCLFLHKPVSKHDMAKTLRKALDGR